MSLLVNNTHTKISLQVDDKQDVFGRSLKHYGVARLCKSRYCYGILKLSVMHYQVLLSSFSYMGLS